MGPFGQIPQGRPNGFHLESKAACEGNQPSLRVFRPDMFAIRAPRIRWFMSPDPRIRTRSGQNIFLRSIPRYRPVGSTRKG